MESHERFDAVFIQKVEQAADLDIMSEAATVAMKNIETLSKARPPVPESAPDPEFVPTTTLEKVQATVGRIWDNETTRVLIKAGGAFAGVALVAYSTIHKDHVIERQAIAQANQRNS
jgi:hypothetical protein